MGGDDLDEQYVPHVMIDGDTKIFMKEEVDKIINSSPGFSTPGTDIKVVSVVGAQNSGKSTLMNSLFGCRFEVMNAEEGIQQTTKGLWASECIIPNLLVVDVEGSDGKERAKDGDTSFKRKSALFALAVSDVMIFNMWAKDVGKHHAGGVPLFEMIFQERVKLEEGQTNLLVVLRAYDRKTPFSKLEKKMVESMKEIWDKVNNPQGLEDFPFGRYIDVKVVALVDSVFQEEKFETEVAVLREWFETIAFVRFQHHKVIAAEFSFSVHELWNQILENKQLDLPTHREMVSVHFCAEVKRRCLASLDSDLEYLHLKDGVTESPHDFSNKLESLLQRLIHRYDLETKSYDAGVKVGKKKELIDEVIYITGTYMHNILTKTLCKIHDEGIVLIYSERNADPTANVHELIETCVHKFTDTIQVLIPRYPALSSYDFANTLRFDLVRQAEIQQGSQRKYEELEKAKRQSEKERQKAEQKVIEAEKWAAEAKGMAEKEMLAKELANLRLEKEKAVSEAERKLREADQARLALQPRTIGQKIGHTVGMGLAAFIDALPFSRLWT